MKKSIFKYEYIIIFFLVLMQEVFFIVDIDKININGKFAYADIWLIIYVLFWGLVFVKYCIKGDKGIYKFGKYIIIFCVGVFISSFMENKATGQSIILGIRPQRYYLIILLSYFPLRHLVYRNKIDFELLFKIIFYVGIFSTLLFIFQKIIINKYQFLHVMINSRNGGKRFYIDSSIIQLSAILGIYYFYKKNNIWYLISSGIIIFYLFWVTQGRLELLAVVITLAIGVFIFGKLNKKKIALIFGAIILIIIALNTKYMKDIIKSINTMKTTTAAQGNTMEIRIIGRELYFSQLSNSIEDFLFGCGYPNKLWKASVKRAGIDRNIYLNDNGIYGYTYIYGICGLIVLICFFIKFFYMSLKTFKSRRNIIPLLYNILNLILAYNIIFWYWKSDGTFILILMLCYIESLENQKKFLNISNEKEMV